MTQRFRDQGQAGAACDRKRCKAMAQIMDANIG
jgi:hypothetical protein